ncbi:MAG: MarR family winged helix-turn-helix transcriptional regulator [Clostridiales bacterium]|nr:MarR family winged helix-turn-helix transcriptional regulator [Eubacteriales bacterium]MDH7567247.1 MarR family winged helix-turn-helix transcriptional regulator [Clostridiales bacterium]
MKDGRPSLIRLINILYRRTQVYTNGVLAKYQLSSGTYPFLLMLNGKEGINQNQLSRELSLDKAASARAIKRLIDLGYLVKEGNREDSRAFNLFLTEKAKAVIPVVMAELHQWMDIITEGLREEERDLLANLLGRVLENVKKYKSKRCGNEG